MTPTEGPVAGEGRRPGLELAAAALLVVAGVVGLIWWLAAGGGGREGAQGRQVAVAGRVGERFLGPLACRECHVGIYSQYMKSGHARTLRPAGERALAQWLVGQNEVADPEQPGVSWQYEMRGDELVTRRREGQRVDEQGVQFAFGSGHHATTFLTVTGQDPTRAREQRLTYYAHRDALGITPGQESYDPASGTTELGRDLSADFTYLCFACHTTITSGDDLERLDVATMIPNVTCERCHGPGKEHVTAAEREAMELTVPFGSRTGPERWTVRSLMQMCGGCHRLPEMVSPEVIRPDNPELARFQPAAMLQSRCYKESSGRLHCLSCHDPHGPASRDQAAYERVCLECHGPSPGQAQCVVSPTENCVGCHMPGRDAGQGVLFTDHWIRVWK